MWTLHLPPGPRWSNQQPLVSPILPGLPRLPILEQSEEAAGYLQQQGTELEVGLGGQQGQEAEVSSVQPGRGDGGRGLWALWMLASDIASHASPRRLGGVARRD